MKTRLKTKQKIVFIGDSITDSGRRDEFASLGNGFVKIFAEMLADQETGKQIDIINSGWNGNTVEELKKRWMKDVISYSPDWIIVEIGINDLFQYLSNGNSTNHSPMNFLNSYDFILRLSIDKIPSVNLVLIDPFYLAWKYAPDSHQGEIMEIINNYLGIVKDLSDKYQAFHIETHKIFQDKFITEPVSKYCEEPVHPNETGHKLIASELFRILSVE